LLNLILFKRHKFIALATIMVVILSLVYISYEFFFAKHVETPSTEAIYYGEGVVYLPLPRIRKDVLSVEEAIAYRRSIRSYRNEALSIQQLSQILWAAYGVSDPYNRLKTTPSAGATYPLEIYVVVKTNGVLVDNNTYLKPGSYKYLADKHALVLVKEGDLSKELMEASLNQEWVGEAPVNIVIAAVFERTTRIYGDRGVRYVYMEVGHAGQNIYLEATALNLGCVVVGAFHDTMVKQVVGLGENEEPMYVIPIGVPEKTFRVSEEDIHRYIIENRG